VFDIRRNILLYAARRLFTLEEEKFYLLNAVRLSNGKLSSTVFGQCNAAAPVCCSAFPLFVVELLGLQRC
jgi:hypothetical protein